MTDDLQAILLESLPLPRRSAAAGGPALGDRLAAIVAEASGAFTAFTLEPEAFVLYLAERLPVDVAVDIALGRVHGVDLYLAAACARGDGAAIAELERRHGGHIARTLDGFQNRRLLPDDLHQIVRQKLFMAGESTGPLIARFAGQGKLSSWLRVTAKRLALNALRDHAEKLNLESEDAALEIPDELADAELVFLKGTYGQAFRESFAAAVARLPERARTLLRLSIVERVSVRRLGTMYGAHAATAARWLAGARRELVELTIEELGQRADLSAESLDSALALIQSRIDVSVSRLLGGE